MQRKSWWVWTRLVLMAVVLVALATFLLAFPLFPSGRLVLEEGDVAPRDIRAPRRITFDSEIRTMEQQRLAEQAVEPVYTPPDAALAREQLDRTQQVLDYLGSVHADTVATPTQRRAWLLAVPELADLPIEIADGLLALSDESWGRVQLETLSVVDEMMRRGVVDGFVDEAWQAVPLLVGLDLSPEEADVTAALARRLIVANSFYDAAATQAARDQAREQVPPVLRNYEAGEIVVREGKRVDALDLEALRELGLQQSRTSWVDVAGQGLLALAAVVLLGLFLARFQPDVLWEGRKLLLLGLLLALFFFLARLLVPDRTVLQYLYPASALAMLATVTLGQHTGLAVSLLMGAVVGLIANQPLELASYTVLGGLVATLSLQKADHPGALFRAALFVAMVHVVVLLGFQLPLERTDLVDVTLSLLAAIVNGLVSASMALGLLFLIGPLFDIITTFRLIELSRPDQPLLQRLLRESPGTYHHSLMVANLAEQAAERIGANALLTRVGAYYHDVGKIARPYFFVENQMEGVNPHQQLDPRTSADIIIQHVQDGLELARRYRLPSQIRAFIPEHHGTNRASFLYEKAVELAGGDASLVDESFFRHRGPKPQSRETALVMLADGSEAIVRANRPASPEELAEAVQKIFDRAIRSGQLDECPITMKDLAMVQDSFISTLKGVFHPRIHYPEIAATEEEAPVLT
ncbi:MAG: HDIG domain-containing protein [Anaerolineae bacterium]|nr:HDIG domain-containing protein [Anaerolineae bacterium]